MSVVLDYLVKINTDQASKIIDSVVFEKLNIQMKIYGSDTIHLVKLLTTSKKNTYTILYKGKDFDDAITLTFKAELAGRLFFFKIDSIPDSKTLIINRMTSIYELVRRKEPRFRVPINWLQFAMVYTSSQKNFKALARINELSGSGMKITLNPELPRYEVNQKIKIQFKIHKRAQVSVFGFVRHLKKNKTGGPTLGIEFTEISDLNKLKVLSICDDMSYFYAHRSTDL